MFSQLMDSTSLFLTANTDTVYFWGNVSLADGPMVMEAPPNVLGVIDDFWFRGEVIEDNEADKVAHLGTTTTSDQDWQRGARGQS